MLFFRGLIGFLSVPWLGTAPQFPLGHEAIVSRERSQGQASARFVAVLLLEPLPAMGSGLGVQARQFSEAVDAVTSEVHGSGHGPDSEPHRRSLFFSYHSTG